MQLSIVVGVVTGVAVWIGNRRKAIIIVVSARDTHVAHSNVRHKRALTKITMLLH